MSARRNNGSSSSSTPQGHAAPANVATQLARIAGLAEVACAELERGHTRNGAACAALALLAASELLGSAPARESGGVESWLRSTRRTLSAALRA